MPLPVAFQSLFSKKGDKPYLFSALLAPAKSDEAAEQSGAKDETTPPPFSLASVKKELVKLKEQSSSSAQDVTQIHDNLSYLYQISHALEAAIASAQEQLSSSNSTSSTSSTSSNNNDQKSDMPQDSTSLMPGFDCSLDQLNQTLTDVAVEINTWLDVLSSGPPEIDSNALVFDRKTDLIGKGAFGEVFRGKLSGSDVAIKIPTYQLEESSTSELEEVRQEIRVLRKIFHPNVVLVLGACTKPGFIRIVFELMKTSVKSLICESHYKYHQVFNSKKKLKLIKDVARGIAWLHSPSVKIIHRDLKLDNLMVDFNDNGKVCDFGLGVFKKGNETIKDTIKGNLLYRAPELMKHSRGQARQVEFTEKIDVYGFAILLWEIYRGEEWYPPHPYDEPSSYCDFVCDGRRPLLNNTDSISWPPLLRELVAACWAQDPTLRPAIEEVVSACEGVEFEQWKVVVAKKISSDIGRQFWLKHFSDESVLWHEFRGVVARQVRMSGRSAAPSANNKEPIVRFGALRRMLCCDFSVEKSLQTLSDRVTIQSFNMVQASFGPFFVRDLAPTIMSEIDAVVSQAWFHGHISRQVAEERLKVTHRELGTFLVRVSVSQPNVPFVISYVGSSKNGNTHAIHHLKVTRPNWGKSTLLMDGVEFGSLQECVERGRERDILLTACDTKVPLNPYDEQM